MPIISILIFFATFVFIVLVGLCIYLTFYNKRKQKATDKFISQANNLRPTVFQNIKLRYSESSGLKTYIYPSNLCDLYLFDNYLAIIRRQDFVFIGSTSAYEGFANTVPYSSAKFALRGLVSALNSEYKNSQRRFFLASMGTMQSKMGKKLTEQDFSTFLMPNRVAIRILDGVLDETGNFEPEIIIRRRVIR